MRQTPTTIRFVMLLLLPFLSRATWAAAVNEVEPNNSIAQAQNIDAAFSSDFNANIGDSVGNNTSMSIPNASVNATGEPGFFGLGFTHDYFSFTVASIGSQGIFDIDSNTPISDLALYLFDENGQLLAQSRGLTGAATPDPGSFSLNDPFLEYTFASAGIHYIGIASEFSVGFNGGIFGLGPATADEYTLNASVAAVPEPTSVILFGLGAASLFFQRRRRRSNLAT